MQGAPASSGRPESPAPTEGRYAKFYFSLLGAFLGLCLIKFGNPVIFEGRFPPPSNLPEVIHFNWPAAWGWWGAALVGGLALPLLRRPHLGLPKWLLVTPAIWLVWQWIAGLDSIQPQLSRWTVIHFTAAVGFFYAGLLATQQLRAVRLIWLGLTVAICLVVSSGFHQRFGGLEESRTFYEKLAKGEQPPEIQAAFDRPEVRRIWQSPLFQLKVNSPRIYATLFYPNTLAGAILLLVPASLAAVWLAFERASPMARTALVALIGLGAILCLVWSGSKAGWLIALIQAGLTVLLLTSISTKWRNVIVVTVAVVGLGAFVGRNIDYLRKGARSVSARGDYWAAAGQAFLENPVTGTGPGTFGLYYRSRKAAESEMAQLAHNDFVQQASDSGTVGFLAFGALLLGTVASSFKRLWQTQDLLWRMTGVGVIGWAIQSVVEFGLYIPAIAWPGFFLIGYLWANANRIDTRRAPA